MSDFKIEKGIPVKVAGSSSKYPFKDMDIGDSFIIKNISSRATLSSSIRSFSLKTGKTFITRRDGDGIRVWRIS